MSFALPGSGGGVSITINNASSGSSGTGDANELVLPFAFGDASPANIGDVAAGKQILSVQIFITTAFNGSGAALQVGVSGTPADLMAAADNNPAAVGEYSVYTAKSYGALTTLILTITPGSGASAGAGIVVVKYQP